MSTTFRPNFIQRWIQKLVARGSISRMLAPVLHHLDKPLLRFSHNRRSLTTLLSGLPVVVLTSTGARSGLPRATPLVGIPDGENMLLIASSFGRTRHPGWYYNVRAHPRVTLTIAGEPQEYRAVEAKGPERERAWRLATSAYAGFEAYARRAGERTIPVFILSPIPGEGTVSGRN